MTASHSIRDMARFFPFFPCAALLLVGQWFTMSPYLKSWLAPEEEELHRKKARLAELEAQLADRDLELAHSLRILSTSRSATCKTVGGTMRFSTN